MTKKQCLQVLVALFLFVTLGVGVSVIPGVFQDQLGTLFDGELGTLRPSQLRAQGQPVQEPAVQDEPTAQDDDATQVAQEQIFLPFVIDGNGADLQAEQPDETNQPIDGHAHGQPLFESWPPQPIGIEAVSQVAVAPPDSVAGAALLAGYDAMAEAETVALAAANVQTALGEHFVHATTIRTHAKSTTPSGNDTGEIRIVYFSYTNNVTVEAVVAGGAVTAIYTYAAADYQPEPTTAERKRAIELARAYFLAQGERSVASLTGYVIMAYRAHGRTGFYDARVVYVTFHQALDERPEYLAWVDLSNNRILKGTADSLELHAAKTSGLEGASPDSANSNVQEGQ